MEKPSDAVLLRVYLGERARSGGHPLFEAVVMKAREAGLAGATALRGPLGYGRSGRIHSAKILDLSEDLPMVIEIIDSPEAIDAFLPVLKAMAPGVLVTLESVRTLRF